MDQTTLLLLVGAGALIVGIVIGKLVASGSSANSEMAEELKQTQAELEEYKEKVTEHFSKTAELVNNMTESYRDVYRHLADSADQLCGNEQFSLRLESNLNKAAAIEAKAEAPAKPVTSPESVQAEAMPDESAEAVETPKDYAPKTEEDKEGTLSEGYGLHNEEKEPVEPASDHPKA